MSLAIDSEEAADAMDRAGSARGVKLRAVICLDMALEKVGGRVHLGVRRSPLRTAEQTLALARKIRDKRGVVVHGILAYEAQVAGMGDDSPFEPRVNAVVKRWIRSASQTDVKSRRVDIVEALEKDGFELALVNGGGTGSLDSTTPETGVTEVAAGSGLFKPHLFDYYRDAVHARARARRVLRARSRPAAFGADRHVRPYPPFFPACALTAMLTRSWPTTLSGSLSMATLSSLVGGEPS